MTFKRLHWEFQCNYVNFENILEIPLILSSKRVRPEASGRSEFGFGAVDGESWPQSSRVRMGQVTNGNNQRKKRTQTKMTRELSKDGE